MTSAIRNLLWVSAGAIILLLPAILWGRPFVFYDTPAYLGWGRDIVEALQRPWPQAGQAWIAGRPLHGWEIGAHGATPGDLRFTLTLLPARSAFYAVPLYLLTRAGGLWLLAALQAAAAAWTVRAVTRALVPSMSGLIYLSLVAALAALTGLGFEAAYAMPDLFGGLALLAAGALIAVPERLGWSARLGLCAVMAYAGVAHAENILNLAVAAALCVAFHFRAGPSVLARRTAPIAAALSVALVLIGGGATMLDRAFGYPPSMAPFPASRVLADGAGQRYLRQVCPRAALAACDLAAAPPVNLEYYLGVYPLERPSPTALLNPLHMYDQVQFRVVTDAEAAHRERFVAEQARLVRGALLADGPHLAGAMFANGAMEFFNFGVNRDFDSLHGLLVEHTQRRDQMVAITPGAAKCAQGAGRACGDLDLGPLAPLQSLVAWASLALIGAGLIRKAPVGQDDLKPFSICMLLLVTANALLCGGVSGPYDRYQTRVEWLIPLCALLEILQWARRRWAVGVNADRPATFPSPVATIVAAPAAARRS